MKIFPKLILNSLINPLNLVYIQLLLKNSPEYDFRGDKVKSCQIYFFRCLQMWIKIYIQIGLPAKENNKYSKSNALYRSNF